MRRMVATLCLLACLLGIWTAIHAGLSRQQSTIGIASAQLASTSEALRLAPGDPVAHHAHALLLAKLGHAADAIVEFKKAAALRPGDYQLWSELGRVLSDSGDKKAALIAFNEAVRCAPFYAQPRWNLGNLLLSMGRHEEAFAELGRAGASDPNLFIDVVKLAWKLFPGNAAAIERAVRPRTSEARVELSRFFVGRGLPDEALVLFRNTDEVSDSDRDDLISALIAGKWFVQAYEVWLREGPTQNPHPESAWGVIHNAGFERGDGFNEKGFGWQSPPDAGAVIITQDRLEPKEGRGSLSLNWRGVTNISVPALSQLVLVEPATRYRLSYAARTTELVSGTPPFVGVLDAAVDDERFVARSTPFPTGTSPWHDYAFEFSTSKETRAVRIVIQRPKCHEAPCPIFGRSWLDSFSLTKLTTLR
jgi:tetratricopeptide (TPR) repeat protein